MWDKISTEGGSRHFWGSSNYGETVTSVRFRLASYYPPSTVLLDSLPVLQHVIATRIDTFCESQWQCETEVYELRLHYAKI